MDLLTPLNDINEFIPKIYITISLSFSFYFQIKHYIFYFWLRVKNIVFDLVFEVPTFYSVWCSIPSLMAWPQGLWSFRTLQPLVYKIITNNFKLLIIRGMNNHSPTSPGSKKARGSTHLDWKSNLFVFSIAISQAKPLEIPPQTFHKVEVLTIVFCLGNPSWIAYIGFKI